MKKATDASYQHRVRALRITGYLLIAAGVIVLATWFITPLRALWPWLLALPLAVKAGLLIAAAGVILLMGSLIAERLGERELDRSLRDPD